MSGIPSSAEGKHSDRLKEIADSPPVQSIVSVLPQEVPVALVGGVIRDTLLGLETADIDMAVGMSITDALSLFERAGVKVVPTGLHHGTVMCVIDGVHVEITEFRGVNKRDLTEDLLLRDFTINAVAFDLLARALRDPAHGVRDLELGVLRAVGDPLLRFEEDPLRVLRLIRFGPAQGRQLDEASMIGARQVAPQLERIAKERIRVEMEKILLAPMVREALLMMKELDLLVHTVPELLPTIGFEQNKFHIHDVFDHTIEVLEKCPPHPLLRWAALYHDIGKVHTLSIGEDGERHFYEHERVSGDISEVSMERLKFSHGEIQAVSQLVRYHMRPLDCGPSGVRRLMRDLGPLFPLWREFKNADRPAVFDDNRLEEMKTRFDQMVREEQNRVVGSVYGRIAITGDDLISLGMKPGRALGKILEQIKNEVLENPELNQRELLWERAKHLVAAAVPGDS